MRRGDHTPWVRNTSECGPAVPSGHRGVVAAAAVRVQPRVSLSSPHAGVGGRDPARGGDSGLSEPESHRPPLPPASFTKTPPRLPERDIVSPARPRWHRTGSSHTHPPPPTLAARPGVPKQPLALWLRHRRPQEASPGLQPRLVSTPRLRKEFQWEKEEQNLGQAGKGDETARVPGTRLSCEPRGERRKKWNGGGKAEGREGAAAPEGCKNACRDPGRPRAGPATQRRSWAHGEVRGGQDPSDPQPSGARSPPSAASYSLNSSVLLQPDSIHPTLMGLSGELLRPRSAQCPARVDGEGKSPLTDFLGRPRGFLPGVTAAF